MDGEGEVEGEGDEESPEDLFEELEADHEETEGVKEEVIDLGLDVIDLIKEHVETKPLIISNKKDLHKYLTESFATMFFTFNRYV